MIELFSILKFDAVFYSIVGEWMGKYKTFSFQDSKLNCKTSNFRED